MYSRLKIDISWKALFKALISRSNKDKLNHYINDISTFFDNRPVVIAQSVRTLLDAILAELNMPTNSPAMMTGINIADMSTIVSAHGLDIAPIDIDPALMAPLQKDIQHLQSMTSAKVYIHAHLFGTVTEIPYLQNLQSKGVFIIEDLAQAFSGSFFKGSLNVDASLFSFGPIKRKTALGGAVGVFKCAAFAQRIQARLDAYPQRSEIWFKKRILKYMLLKALSYPFPYGILIRIVQFIGKNPDSEIGKIARGFSGRSLLSEIRTRPPDTLIQLMQKQICSNAYTSCRQLACHHFYAEISADRVPGVSAENNAYWLVPYISSDPDGLVTALRKAGFDATRGATSLRALSADDHLHAARLMENIVYLPHPAYISETALNNMKRCIVHFEKSTILYNNNLP